MPPYTIQWTCPICGASKTSLRQGCSDTPVESVQVETSGLLGHIRQMTDESHGGRGKYPGDEAWVDKITAECVNVAPFPPAPSPNE